MGDGIRRVKCAWCVNASNGCSLAGMDEDWQDRSRVCERFVLAEAADPVPDTVNTANPEFEPLAAKIAKCECQAHRCYAVDCEETAARWRLCPGHALAGHRYSDEWVGQILFS